MKKATVKLKLQMLEPRLKYGAKSEIARKTGENKHNVQTAFRGMAGEELTLIVYREARKLPTKFLERPKKGAKQSV